MTANGDGGQQWATAKGSGDGQQLQLRAKRWAVATAVWMVTAMVGFIIGALFLCVHNKAHF